MRFSIQSPNETKSAATPRLTTGTLTEATDPILAKIYAALRPYPDAHTAVDKILAEWDSERQSQPEPTPTELGAMS